MMFRSYLYLAVKILLRRKFFTVISLFCISITLMVLMLLSVIVENGISPMGAEKNSHRCLGIQEIEVQSKDRKISRSLIPGYAFLSNYVYQMEVPELVSIYSRYYESVGYVNGIRVTTDLRRADANYWKIMTFDFVEGRAISESESRQGKYVAVINEATRDKFFNEKKVVGEIISTGGGKYTIVGVVKNISFQQETAYADIWVPIFSHHSGAFKYELFDGFRALMMAKHEDDIPLMKKEFSNLVRDFKHPDPKRWPYVYVHADTKFEYNARELFDNETQKDSGSVELIVYMVIVAILFMILPAMNLVGLNITRMQERASEIGVRKSFGATSLVLVKQFLMENLLLTAIGGFLGFLLSLFALTMISISGVIPYASFEFNGRMFFYGISLVFVFGVLSGVYPAWKMSRMHPVSALRGVV